MKKWILPLAAAVVLALGSFGCKAEEEIVPGPTPKQASPNVIVNNQQTPAEHMIEVGGYGSVIASPDYATVRIGVSGAAETAEAASAKCETNLAAVLENADAMGVPKSSISNAGTGITAQQRPSDGAITGYLAADVVTITMDDVTAANTVASGIIDKAVCELKGITYSLTDATLSYQSALEAAMADALAKAETLAKAGTVNLGAVVGVVETPLDDSRIVGVDFDTSAIEVTAKVTVRYLIR